MFRDLLVHVDRSQAGRRRVQFAVGLAVRIGARLNGIQVTPPAEVPPLYKPSLVEQVLSISRPSWPSIPTRRLRCSAKKPQGAWLTHADSMPKVKWPLASATERATRTSSSSGSTNGKVRLKLSTDRTARASFADSEMGALRTDSRNRAVKHLLYWVLGGKQCELDAERICVNGKNVPVNCRLLH